MIGLSFQHKLIHPGNYLYLAESELHCTMDKSLDSKTLEKETVYVSVH